MKGFHILLIVLSFTVFSLNANAQKIKIKKDIAQVDGKDYIKFDECGTFSSTCTIMTLDDEDLIALQYESFQKPNPNPRNPKYKGPYQSTVTESYTIGKFLDFDLEFETSMTKKKLVKALYKMQVIDESGDINKENAEKFVRKYGEDISSNRPSVIITN